MLITTKNAKTFQKSLNRLLKKQDISENLTIYFKNLSKIF